MIAFLIGTKAQLIKCAPVIHALRDRTIPFRLVDTGQHAGTTRALLQGLDLPPFDAALSVEDADIATVKAGVSWLVRTSIGCWTHRDRIRESLGRSTRLALVHGDTASTWVGALAAGRCGIPFGHLESGLSSGSRLSPFPEELIRRSVMKRAAALFAPGEWAAQTIRQREYRGELVTLSGNTNQESLQFALDRLPPPERNEQPYTLISIHRFETIQSLRELRRLVNAVVEWSRNGRVRFVVHAPTRKRLEKTGLWEILSRSSVELLPPHDYHGFVHLLRDAEAVVTDGGSVQEECAYLGKPCLIWRETTERPDGLSENALLSERNPHKAGEFFTRLETYRRPPRPLTTRPSEEVAQWLMEQM